MKRPYSELMEKANCVQYALAEKIYQLGRTDAIEEVIKSLEAQFLMQNNPNSKFVETIVLHRDFIDKLEQLKEQK